MEDEIIEMKTKKQSRSFVPNKAVDIITVAFLAAAAWKKSGLILKWTTYEELLSDAGEFKATFEAWQKTSGERRVITRTLKSVNEEINRSLKYLKSYIADICKADEVYAYYAQFGIVREKGMYIVSRDNDSRQKALEQMVNAIVVHGLSERNYGLAYWSKIYEQFLAAKTNASEHDSDSAEQKSIKNECGTRILKTLEALVSLVKCNYPDTWKDELRVWGFQKEKY